MKRLTLADWQIINAALAYLDATDYAGEMCMEDDEAAQFDATIQSARAKVWERIPENQQ